MIAATNANIQAATAIQLLSDKRAAMIEVKTGPQIKFLNNMIFSVETCIQLELSLEKEIEAVYIDRESDGNYKVISVVNERNPEIRDRVYQREEAIMEAYPTMRFDFHVLARMNRKLEDVITKANKVIFER